MVNILKILTLKTLKFICITGAIFIGILLGNNFLEDILYGTLLGTITRIICNSIDAISPIKIIVIPEENEKS